MIVMITVIAVAWGSPPGHRDGRVSGRVTGLDGADHVVIKVVGPETYSTTTRFHGRWEINGVLYGRYTVTPHHDRYRFEPETRIVVVDIERIEKIDFRATPIPPGAGEVTGRGDDTSGSSMEGGEPWDVGTWPLEPSHFSR